LIFQFQFSIFQFLVSNFQFRLSTLVLSTKLEHYSNFPSPAFSSA
jgi:hypothetical protein